jgi:hypothetical protein
MDKWIFKWEGGSRQEIIGKQLAIMAEEANLKAQKKVREVISKS